MTKIYTGKDPDLILKAMKVISGPMLHWPEIANDGSFPIHVDNQVQNASLLVGWTFCTMSPVIILWFLTAVRCKRIASKDLEIVYVDEDGETVQGVGDDGDLLAPWCDNLWDNQYKLRFCREAEFEKTPASVKPE